MKLTDILRLAHERAIETGDASRPEFHNQLWNAAELLKQGMLNRNNTEGYKSLQLIAEASRDLYEALTTADKAQQTFRELLNATEPAQ